MNRPVAFHLAPLVLASLTAVALGQTYTKTADGMHIVATSPAKAVVPATTPAKPGDGSPVIIFNNLSEYKYATYFCCEATTIQGPDAQQGGPGAIWRAIPITPRANLTLTEIEAPFFTLFGTPSIAVWLAADSGGVPGDTIAGPIDANNLPSFFGCCTLTTVTFPNVPLTKGTHYWIVVGTDANSINSMDGWNSNTIDMRPHPAAIYATTNGKWLAHSDVLPAIRVLGQ